MKLRDLIKVLSTRIIFDVLDSETKEVIKWENKESFDNEFNCKNADFFRKYGNREVDTIIPLNQNKIEWRIIIKLKERES